MVAIIGMFFQDGLTGSAWGDWAIDLGGASMSALRLSCRSCARAVTHAHIHRCSPSASEYGRARPSPRALSTRVPLGSRSRSSVSCILDRSAVLAATRNTCNTFCRCSEANYTESPLRAFENELGVQAPVGFWDPAGFTSLGRRDGVTSKGAGCEAASLMDLSPIHLRFGLGANAV